MLVAATFDYILFSEEREEGMRRHPNEHHKKHVKMWRLRDWTEHLQLATENSTTSFTTALLLSHTYFHNGSLLCSTRPTRDRH